MRKLFFLFIVSFGYHSIDAQVKYKVTAGEEIKLKSMGTDLDMVAADNSGVYFSETYAKKESGFMKSNILTVVKLYKFDNKTFNKVWDETYDKELNGADFHSFASIEDNLFIFATEYIRKEKVYKVYGGRIDKNTGKLMEEMKELGTYDMETAKDDFGISFQQLVGTKDLLMVTDVSNYGRNILAFLVLDAKLKVKQRAFVNLNLDRDRFGLESMKYTMGGKIVILGREYERVPTGKKNKTKKVFKQYLITTYSKEGKKEKEIAVGQTDKYIVNGSLIEQPNGELLLAGFYSNEPNKSNLNGVFVSKIDIPNGKILISSFKEINEAMLGKDLEDSNDDDDDDEAKENKKIIKKAKDQGDDEDFPNEFIIRTILISPKDSSLVIAAEVYEHKSYSFTNSTMVNGSWRNTYVAVNQFINKDILVVNATKSGQINWVNVIPKSQFEESKRESNSPVSGWYGTSTYSFFLRGGGMPFFSSFISTITDNNKLVFVLNDHKNNTVVGKYGDKVKRISNFRKYSDVYGISIDLESGKMTKKMIAGNEDDFIMMPRHAYVVKDQVYIPTLRRGSLFSKSRIKVTKVEVN